jgi:prepilin-type N-terminal cleavage/methylation domain-containing protein
MLTRASLSRRAPRPGVTLAELLVVLVIMGLVGSVIMRVVLRQQRFYASAAEITSTRADLRDLATALPTDLRGISSAGGDIYAMSDSSIDFRLPLGMATICQVGAGLTSVVVPPASLASRSGVTSWLSQPVMGDSVLIYDDGTTTAVSDDAWRPYKINAAPTTASCPTTTNFTSTSAEAAAGTSFTLSTAMPATSPQGSAMIFFRRAHYGLFKTASGKTMLGYFDCPGGTCGAVTPIGGPFLPYATSGSGVQFAYYDSTGVVTTSTTNVARIDVVLRAQTAAPVALVGGTKSYLRDSLAFTVSLRNRQ